jgi:Spy/CpxP family protein refolding chaperone
MERRELRGDREGRGGHETRRWRGGPGLGHLMRELNLADEQRQQVRFIMQRRLEGTKAQREELFKLREKRIAGTFTADDEAQAKALREQIRASMQGLHAEMEGILTPEQKTKLEELKKEHKAKIEQRMNERQQYLKNKPQ